MLREQNNRILALNRRIGPKKAQFVHSYAASISARRLYLAEASKLCEMLCRCQGYARNVIEQVDLMAQRDRESKAHADYIRAYKRLLRISGLGRLGKRPIAPRDRRASRRDGMQHVQRMHTALEPEK